MGQRIVWESTALQVRKIPPNLKRGSNLRPGRGLLRLPSSSASPAFRRYTRGLLVLAETEERNAPKRALAMRACFRAPQREKILRDSETFVRGGLKFINRLFHTKWALLKRKLIMNEIENEA